MASGQIRISLLNPGSEVTALKLRGWLHKEAEQIQSAAGPDDNVILRVYLTKRVRYGFTLQKIDSLIQSVVDKYPNILRIILILVDQPLSLEEMKQEAEDANAELEEMVLGAAALSKAMAKRPEEVGLIQYFGYSTDAAEGESAFDFPEAGLVCMVSNITPHNREPISGQTGRAFELDQWFVSEGGHEETRVHGPFINDGEAMSFARENCRAIRFKSAPEFEFN